MKRKETLHRLHQKRSKRQQKRINKEREMELLLSVDDNREASEGDCHSEEGTGGLFERQVET